MTQIFDSRKPEPYIKSSCKKCITPIEFYPQGCAVGHKVSVKCWACGQVDSYTVTEPSMTTNQQEPKSSASKSRTTRKRGTGKFFIATVVAVACYLRWSPFSSPRSKPYIHWILWDPWSFSYCDSRRNKKGIQKTCCHPSPRQESRRPHHGRKGMYKNVKQAYPYATWGGGSCNTLCHSLRNCQKLIRFYRIQSFEKSTMSMVRILA